MAVSLMPGTDRLNRHGLTRGLGALALATIFFVFLASTSQAKAADGDGLLAKASSDIKPSIVYIRVMGENTKTFEREEYNATGFIISNEGYVLTASHVLRDKDGEQYRVPPTVTGVIGGKYTTRAYPLRIVEQNDQTDVALLKFPEIEEKMAAITACRDTPSQGDTLFAFGFPYDEDFTPLDGNFNNASGGRGRWVVTMPFTHGMSGGPVTDVDGNVRGIAHGGKRGEPAVRWVTPIRYASTFLTAFDVPDRCDTARSASGEVACRKAGKSWDVVHGTRDATQLIDFLREHGKACPIYNQNAMIEAERVVYGPHIAELERNKGLQEKFFYFRDEMNDDVKAVIFQLYAPTMCQFNHAVSCLFMGAYNIDCCSGSVGDEADLLTFETWLSPLETFEYFKKACELGNALGCTAAGITLNNSDIISMRDYDNALAFFKRACRLGNYNGCGGAGIVLFARLNKEEEAESYLEGACKSGDGFACAILCDAYSNVDWACSKSQELGLSN